MTFPFVIELEQKIKTTGDTDSLLNVYTIIQVYLKSKSVDDFYKTENTIKFKKWFGMNTNVFSLTTAMTIGFGLLSGQFLFAVVVFFVIVVGNFLICLVRQQGVMNDLVYNIDEAYRNIKNGNC